ncbi:MAG: hypothetical protein HY566_02315 [Candidatus Kerfeldbacteria bacterium]|nr:hypothetical protein [Candidatus Kerfeldbacteria bacterium]
MDCPFCSPEHLAHRTLEEKEFVRVIASDPRLMRAHLLVIPKRHIERPSELTKNERDELFDTLFTYQVKILERIAPGCDIRENLRPFQKESRLKRHHLHFHLQPRTFEDELYQSSQRHETALFRPLDDDEMEALRELFA